MSKILRDAEDYAPVTEASAPYRRHWDRARYALVGGWGVEDRRLDASGGAGARPEFLDLALAGG